MSVKTMATLTKILVPMDFSHNSAAAVNYACDLATDANAELHLLHVANGAQSEGDKEEDLRRMSSALDARTELNLSTFKHIATGKPDQAITTYAKDHAIDMVVMGTHGRSALAHLTLGSVAEKVVRNSPCPVVMLGPGDGLNASLAAAIRVTQNVLGTGMLVDEEEGRGRMLRELVQELRVPSAQAILLLKELQESGQLKWENGTWTIAPKRGVPKSIPQPLVGDSGPASHAVDLLNKALDLRATDIHIDPVNDDESLIRMRIDGRLREYCHMSRSLAEHMCNQLKAMANLPITDPFHAHEGRVKLPSSFVHTEVRITTVPVSEGQAMALRLFDSQNVFLPLEHLGFSTEVLPRVQKLLSTGEGLVLVTGPTGSGKTTTVYSMLATFNEKDCSIASIEDPVEFSAPFVRQISVDERHDLSMSDGLRVLLRMDPDIIFLGEIRDSAAAKIAMQAVASGKYIFSSLHTRSVASTILALREHELDSRSIASNLTGVVNQRIVRRLCNECKQVEAIEDKHREAFEGVGLEVPHTLFNSAACEACNGTGYRGRIGIFEVAEVTSALRQAILDNLRIEELEELMRSQDVEDLQTDALKKAAAGIISFQDAVLVG